MTGPGLHLAQRPFWLFDLPTQALLYQDAAVVVVDKPAGVPSQSPSADQPEDVPSLIMRRLARERHVPEASVYLGTHQRLDRDTSGVLLYSLDPTVNAALAEQFAGRSVDKRYLAAVSGKPPHVGSVLEHWLVPAGRGTMRVGHAHEPGAKLARTRIVAVQTHGPRSLISLAIDTGRTHQVRVQLAAIGCPVAGDPLYGGQRALRLLLHSHELSFAHPTTGERLRFEAPVPLELQRWLAEPLADLAADPALLQRTLELAAARRVGFLRAYEGGDTTAFRWVNGRADGLDDIYIDVYDRFLVVRVDGDGREAQEAAVLAAAASCGFGGAYIKRHPRQANDIVDPRHEQFAPREPAWGAAAPEPLVVHERGVPLEVCLSEGLRTGLYLDQRDNRALLWQLAADKSVLNLFGYTGSFSTVALVAGATRVRTVDLSRSALAWANRNVARVGAAARHDTMAEDAFVALRAMHARGELFDCVVLDPPSYSSSKRGRFRVLKDYTALCAAALRVLAPGGALIACVNHHGVSQAQLRRFIQTAARDAGCTLESLRDQTPARDFPVLPEDEPAMKSAIARLAKGHVARRARPRMHSASAGMKPNRR
jgi:23S rRNA (cytosine1962-C5)-methyltransferase